MNLVAAVCAIARSRRLPRPRQQAGITSSVLDIRQGVFTDLIGLGFKDHSAAGNGLDASDRDGPSINIANWPVFGMYEPDAIASFRYREQTYLITANEGDTRDYPGFNEERRVSALTLDPIAFPNGATLKTNAQLGRLTVTSVKGDTSNESLRRDEISRPLLPSFENLLPLHLI